MLNSIPNYIELPLKVFLQRYPWLSDKFSSVIDINDSNYVVRFSISFNGKYIIEFGYPGDDWELK